MNWAAATVWKDSHSMEVVAIGYLATLLQQEIRRSGLQKTKTF
jgi:hypothetical protein